MITQLKGGSLSTTTLHDGDKPFVRKSIDRATDREYGYVRWYSQLKKLQQINTEFPRLVPRILRVGVDGQQAYYDMEYLDGYTDIKTLLCERKLTGAQIVKMHNAVWRAFDQLHSMTLCKMPGGPQLYFKEEIWQKLEDACRSLEFEQFEEQALHSFNGELVPRIWTHFKSIEKHFDELVLSSEEMIHGNPTLENLMYSFEHDYVAFIDVYSESCIDSKLLDYAQVLQCSHGHYGFINDRQVRVSHGDVSHDLAIPENLKLFNILFECELELRVPEHKKTIALLEASQFIRMLPFKVLAGELDKAKFFYVLACKLFHEAMRP